MNGSLTLSATFLLGLIASGHCPLMRRHQRALSCRTPRATGCAWTTETGSARSAIRLGR